MCECGCPMRGKFFKLPGPKGVWYQIHIYPGCEDCDAPAGITVAEIASKEARECFCLDDISAPKWVKTYSWREFSEPVFDPNKLEQKLVDQFGERFPGDPPGDQIDDWRSEIRAAGYEAVLQTVASSKTHPAPGGG